MMREKRRKSQILEVNCFMNNNSNHYNVKRKLNSILLISFIVSIFLLIITFLSIDEKKIIFNYSY